MCLCRLVKTITRKQDLNTRGQMCEALEAHAGWLNDNVDVSDGAIFLVGLAGALSDRTDIEGPRHALDVIKNLDRLPSDTQDDGTTTHWGWNRQISDSQNGIDFSNSPRPDTDYIFKDDFYSKHSSVLGICFFLLDRRCSNCYGQDFANSPTRSVRAKRLIPVYQSA